MTKPSFDHLTMEEHQELARLLNQAQDNLLAAAKLVNRAFYSDKTLRIQARVQYKLIQPLREAWSDSQPWDDNEYQNNNPYQSVGYWV